MFVSRKAKIKIAVISLLQLLAIGSSVQAGDDDLSLTAFSSENLSGNNFEKLEALYARGNQNVKAGFFMSDQIWQGKCAFRTYGNYLSPETEAILKKSSNTLYPKTLMNHCRTTSDPVLGESVSIFQTVSILDLTKEKWLEMFRSLLPSDGSQPQERWWTEMPQTGRTSVATVPVGYRTIYEGQNGYQIGSKMTHKTFSLMKKDDKHVLFTRVDKPSPTSPVVEYCYFLASSLGTPSLLND